MRFSVLSSGSSGNVTYVEAEGPSRRGVLVDVGVSCRRLKRLLGSLGRSPDDVDAVLLTHGHSDHTAGLSSLLAEKNVPVLCAPGVGEDLGAEVVMAGESFSVGPFEISYFRVPHDAPTYGVRISDGEVSMAVATDFGEVAEGMLGAMSGVQAVVLEANHDLRWLQLGPYSAQLKRRIASPDGHLSNDQAADFALALAPHGLKDIVLAHLSETNNSPARACGTVGRTLREAGFGGVRVRAAIAGRPTPWVEVGEPLPEPEIQTYRPIFGESGRLFGLEKG